jgi:hypothetical protein
VENHVFHQPKVREAFQNFVVAEIFADEPDSDLRAKNQALQDRLAQQPTLPLYFVVRPRDEAEVSRWAYPPARDPDNFAYLLNRALETFELLEGARGGGGGR